MHILIADSFPNTALAAIETDGARCEYRPEITAEELPDTVGDADVLVVRSTRVDAQTIAAGRRLRSVIRAGSGTNTIDRDAAATRGVAVCNVPGRNAIAVAELAFALLLSLDRQVPDAVADLRAGRWDKARYGQAQGLYGRSIGVVGLGDIGLAFAERAHAFGMRPHAIAKSGRAPEVAARAQACDVRFVPDLATLTGSCDVLSFHVPVSETTRGMVSRELLANCRDGAWIINTSRGEIVDEPALIDALDTRGMRAGLDVFDGEPTAPAGAFDSPLARHPSVYGTHHVGASTEQAQQAVADEVVRMIDAFAEGRLLHCVNGVAEPVAEPLLDAAVRS